MTRELRAAATRPRAARCWRPRPAYPARASSAPAGGGALACQRGGLSCDLRALLDPLVEVLEVHGAAARGDGALCREPTLHGREELAGEHAVAGVQVEVCLLRVGDAAHPEVRLAAVLERIGVAGLERERLVVGCERVIVVAELAAGVADVVPRPLPGGL